MVELSPSVLDLLVAGENRVFNFVEAMNPINLRKEVVNCLPATFQFWTIPEVWKLLDENICLLVFGGSLLKETDNETSKGFLSRLLRLLNFYVTFPQSLSVQTRFF